MFHMLNWESSKYDPNTYIASRYDDSWNIISSTLVEILSDSEKIGDGHYGSVNQVKLHLWSKELPFAKKSFRTLEEMKYALQMYHNVKSAKLPTWNTYRHLEGTNDILMTLGNVDGSLVFSPHNNSKDRKMVKKTHLLDTISNKEAFFEQAFSVLVQATEKNILLPWDTYFLKLKSWELSFIVWDFDLVSVWEREHTTQWKLEQNIKEFFGFLSGIVVYLDVDYREAFFQALKQKQDEWNPLLVDVDLESLYQWCKFIREE